ncbi:class I SAM-dependent methyltransferase [Endozoicomonadaceae bacterium StTr2]
MSSDPTVIPELYRQLAEWLETPAGQYLLEQERKILEQALPGIFGYQLLQLGIKPDLTLVSRCGIAHKTMLSPWSGQEDKGAFIQGSMLSWPIREETLDMVFLHHVLEFSSAPRAVLREASRCLIAGGKLVIVGFNPFSVWNMIRWVYPGLKLMRGNASPLRAARLQDWLELLGFRVDSINHGIGLFPLGRNHPQWVQKMARFARKTGLPVGGIYVIVATRVYPGLTPLRGRWNGARSLIGPAVPGSSAQSVFRSTHFESDLIDFSGLQVNKQDTE